MIKIHIPPIEKFEIQKNKGEYNHILKDGIILNNKTELTESHTDADYIFLDFRHINNRSGYHLSSFKNEWLDRTVIIDYADSHNISNIPVNFYFKRSVVDKNKHSLITYDRTIHPISYCIKNDCLDFKLKPISKRKYDISVFFRTPDLMNKSGMNNRALIAQYIKDNFKNKNTWVGIVGSDGESGRMSDSNTDYYKIMLDSKIVVNCNPDMWEGDYRLFEALSCAPLVMSDPMITPIINPLINEKHIVYYDSLEMLKSKIIYYLNNISELEKISKSGYEYAMMYHKTSDRIDEILKIITK